MSAAQILSRVTDNPGDTARELRSFGETISSIRWKLFQLEKAGKIHKGPRRLCTVTYRESITWFPGAAAGVPLNA
jgi:predicted transcriptional regulator